MLYLLNFYVLEVLCSTAALATSSTYFWIIEPVAAAGKGRPCAIGYWFEGEFIPTTFI